MKRFGPLVLILLLVTLALPATAAGPCSILRSWGTGDSLTASDLTDSFTQVGVTNMVPTCVDDYSSDVSQMQSTVDPYPSGSPSLPTNLAGELERMRYVIKKLTGWSQWYAHTEGVIGGSQNFRGLLLRTHPDNPSAGTKVYLAHADTITMDNGAAISSWDRLTADVSVGLSAWAVGTGGRDDNSGIAASTWYEIYAIRNSTAGTKGLILHRAKDALLDEDTSAVITEDASHVLNTAATTNVKLSQGFLVDTAGPLVYVDIKIVRAGTIAAGKGLWVTVQSDTSGNPNEAGVLATSDKLDPAQVLTTASFVRFIFRDPASLSASTKYHIVLQTDYTADAVNNIAWRCDCSAAGYRTSDGASKGAFNGTIWTQDTDDDFLLKVYIERNNTALTYPSGYDQKALVGYVFVGAGSTFAPFIAKGRYVTPFTTTNTGTPATTGTLTSLTTFVPPVPVRLELGAGVAAATLGAAPVPDGFGYSATASPVRQLGGIRAIIAAGADLTSILGTVNTETQAVYLHSSVTTARFFVTAWEW